MTCVYPLLGADKTGSDSSRPEEEQNKADFATSAECSSTFHQLSGIVTTSQVGGLEPEHCGASLYVQPP